MSKHSHSKFNDYHKTHPYMSNEIEQIKIKQLSKFFY